MAAAKRKKFAARLSPPEVSSALLCSNCTDDKEVRWKCNDCGGEYCDKCKRIHLIADEGCHEHVVVRYGSRKTTTSVESSSDHGSNPGSFDQTRSVDTHETRRVQAQRAQLEFRTRGYSLPAPTIEVEEISEKLQRTRIKVSTDIPENSDHEGRNEQSSDCLYTQSVEKRTPEVEHIKTSFNCPFGMADNRTVQHIRMAPRGNGQAWVKCGVMSDDIVLCASNGEKVDVVKVRGAIQDFALTWKDEILFTMYNGNTVWKYEKNENIKPFADVPFKPNAICITRGHDVLVAANGASNEPIAKFTCSASKIPFNPNGVPGNLNDIYNLTENVNGDVIIAEKGGWGSGRVVVLKSDGQFKFKFRGQGGLDPSGVTCDLCGFIYVCDIHANNVHVLDIDGNFVSFLIPTINLLTSPESIAIDNTVRVVWIGEGDGKVKLFQLKTS